MPNQNTPEPELDIEAIKGLSPDAARIRVQAMRNAAKTPEEVKKAEQLQILLREKEFAFNQPNAKADYDYWSKNAYWTLGEATALAHGRSPEIVTPALMERCGNISVLAAQYNRTYNLVQRAYRSGEIPQQVKPLKFLEWARRSDISLPEELVECIERRANPAPKPKPEPTSIEKELEWYKFEAQSWKKHFLSQREATERVEKILQEREADISSLKAQLQELEPLKAKAEKENSGYYVSPYMQLMRDAVIANRVDAANPRKKDDLVQWFKDSAPEGLTLSDNQVQMMATLIRSPEATKGGNTKHRKE